MKAAHIYPEDIQTVNDLHRIPITTKEDILASPREHLTADNINLQQCWSYTTSGTTGNRLTIYWDKDAIAESWFLPQYTHHLECGDKITNRRVSLASFTPSPPTIIQKLGIFPTKIISPFDEITDQLNQIHAFDPHTILCTPSSIVQIAKEIKEIGYNINELNVSLIFTAGELLDDRTRSYLMEAFNAKVYDLYGANETGTLGRECTNQKLHVNSHSAFVEITKDGEHVSPDEDGEITVTTLYNYAQPFLRYNLKDIGHLANDTCPCGKHSPVLEITQGRHMDVIQRSDKNPISANEICLPLNFIDGIKQFQVVQETIDTLTVKIVPGSGFSHARYEDTRRLVQQCIGDTMTLNIVIVDNIPREPSGKLQRFKTQLR
jgi:phenylacetate-CoA ligase